VEILFEHHLEILDISAIAEWDVLAFLHRHGTTIAGGVYLVRMIGYNQSMIESALDKLTRSGLIQGSRGSDGIGLYKSIPLDTPARQNSFEALIKLADQRNGRLHLIRAVRMRSNSTT
jgi:hypothetical protein